MTATTDRFIWTEEQIAAMTCDICGEFGFGCTCTEEDALSRMTDQERRDYLAAAYGDIAPTGVTVCGDRVFGIVRASDFAR